jgi:hypothetical protein
MAGGKERLSQPLANQRPVARPKLNREGGLRITCVQKTGCGTSRFVLFAWFGSEMLVAFVDENIQATY